MKVQTQGISWATFPFFRWQMLMVEIQEFMRKFGCHPGGDYYWEG